VHSIVPIIMAVGAISFFIGLFFLARLGMQRLKEINLFGKTYSLWRFTTITIGSGAGLIMLSVLIHQNVPYTPASDVTQEQFTQAGVSEYELGLILENIDRNLIDNYVKQFQKDYYTALANDDKSTAGLLLLELKYNLRTELEKHGTEPSKIEEKINRVVTLLHAQQD
jgi:hypothetical protein